MPQRFRADVAVVPLPLAGGRRSPPTELDERERSILVAVLTPVPPKLSTWQRLLAAAGEIERTLFARNPAAWEALYTSAEDV